MCIHGLGDFLNGPVLLTNFVSSNVRMCLDQRVLCYSVTNFVFLGLCSSA